MHRVRASAMVAIAVAQLASAADEIAAQARKTAADNGAALVTIKLTIKENFSSEDFGSETSEYVLETMGTIIHPDGLVVASLSETDPSQMMESMYASFAEEEGLKIDTQVSDLKIVVADGTEVPGKVVIRDVDLDLALIRPLEKPEIEWPAIKLLESTKADQFDEVVVLYRMGKVTGRVCGGELTRIKAVMEKPRRLYVLGEWTFTPGAPVFAMNGECLGIITVRTIKNADAGGGFMSADDPEVADVVLPVADLLESAGQAPGYDE